MANVSNEKLLLREMSKALDIPASDLEVEESSLSSFREGDAVTIRIKGGGTYGKEWTVVGDEDVAHAIAVASVKQDLESEPELFNKDFIESHIDKEKLRRELMSDVQERYEDLHKDEADRHPLRFMADNDIEIPEPTVKQRMEWAEAFSDEDKSVTALLAELDDMSDAEDRWIAMGEEPEVPDEEIVKVAEVDAADALKDPMSYLDGIYGDEAAKQAIEIAGIDIDAAADEAVSTDGWEHFLSRYDGNSATTPKGFVWWREN